MPWVSEMTGPPPDSLAKIDYEPRNPSPTKNKPQPIDKL
jgi:hypothetical protein